MKGTTTMTTPTIHPNILAGARRWALANKSDPFALATALADARNGISQLTLDDGRKAYYDAVPKVKEHRVVVDGKEIRYHATVWRDMVRP